MSPSGPRMPAHPPQSPTVLALALAVVLVAMPAGARESARDPKAVAALERETPASPRAVAPEASHRAVTREAPVSHPAVDRSGRRRVGIASVYVSHLAGRKMADGTRMDPHDDNAASKTLPLGTEAQVTNLETGRSARVTIQDRGPHVKGRIVDLSPSTARRLGITPKEGIARVEVAPIALPPPAQR
jgi:rare lipoprotein A